MKNFVIIFNLILLAVASSAPLITVDLNNEEAVSFMQFYRNAQWIIWITTILVAGYVIFKSQKSKERFGKVFWFATVGIIVVLLITGLRIGF